MHTTPHGFFGPGDIDRLNAEIDRVRSFEATIGSAQAGRIRALAAMAAIAIDQTSRLPSRDSRLREMPLRSLAAELGAATTQHDRTMQRELDDAFTLTNRFAATVDALAQGRISMRHVSGILDAGAPIADPDVRAAWESTVLGFATTQSPGRTKAYGVELAEAMNPESIAERFSRAVATREISIAELADGMSQVTAVLPTTIARGITDRISRMARRLRDLARAERDASAYAADAPAPAIPAVVVDVRTRRQTEADILADLLLTSTPTIDPTGGDDTGGLGAIRTLVQVIVPVSTLTGVTDTGASLDGRSPIDPDTARRLAGGAVGWDRVMVHPVSGTVLDVDRYEPTAAQRRFLRARDQHCRAPGCRQPAHRCQIDHNHEHHEGGPTALRNLAHFCVRHHTLKSETPWTVHQRDDGTLEFTSPLGNVYEDPPPPRVMFVPSGDPAPF